MAHFLKPPGVTSDGYDVDNKLAPGSIWRLRVPLGGMRDVALWGGSGLTVNCNNPNVTPRNPPRVQQGNLDIFRIKGVSEGGSTLDIWGSNGSFWGAIQIIVEREKISTEPSLYTGEEPGVDLITVYPDPTAVFYSREPLKKLGLTIDKFKPIFDEESDTIIGFSFENTGVFKYYDLEGNFVGGDELGLDTPLLDPIDMICIVRGVATGVGKAIIGAMASAGTKLALRGLIATSIQILRSAFRAIISRRALKFTTTTVTRMTTKERHVPVAILQLAIRYGKREADPQKVKGAVQYTIEMVRNVKPKIPGAVPNMAGKSYTLKVVVRESDNTVLHFHYQ